MKIKPEDVSCYEVQHSIKRYLMNEMTKEEAEKFVIHIRACEECRKELEEYYIFSVALMSLETIEDTETGDFFTDVEKRLERTEQMIARERREHKKRCFAYIVLVAVVAIAMSMSTGL